MGRYRSDESEEERDSSRKHKIKKKSKKRRGQSGSGSDSGGSHISSSRGKKSKRRQGRSSRSPSADRNKGRSSRRSRSRSPSSERYHKSRRRGRRLKSRSGSRSPPSHSQRGRYSRSPYHSRSRSPSVRKNRRRSRSRDQRRRSRSYSRERRSRSGGRSQSRRSSPETRSDASGDMKRMSIKEMTPSSTLTPAQQAEERMRLALKAAAAADQKLRQLPPGTGRGSSPSQTVQGGQDGGQPRFASHEESLKFADSVSAIESGNFKQTAFKSSRAGKPQETAMFDIGSGPSHDDAIFGSLAVTGFTIKPDPDTKPLELDPETIMHPSLFCDPEDKLDRWIERLTQLRKRKLEGDAL